MPNSCCRKCKRPAASSHALRTTSLLLSLLLALAGCRQPEPLRFKVVFENAGGLEEGVPAVHRGLEIGRVNSVGLDSGGMVVIEVEVEEEYRSAVSTTSVVRSESHGLRRRVRLSIEDGPGERVAVSSGDQLRGSPRVLDDALTKLQQGARAAWSKTAESASELQKRLAEAAKESEEEFRRLQREQVPELREQAEKVRERLEEAGLTEEADAFWERFEAWLEEVEKGNGSQAQPPLPPELEPPENTGQDN